MQLVKTIEHLPKCNSYQKRNGSIRKGSQVFRNSAAEAESKQ